MFFTRDSLIVFGYFLFVFVLCFCLLVDGSSVFSSQYSVPVQVIEWKDLSTKCPLMC